jgi:AraC-like DNA-binding protein
MELRRVIPGALLAGPPRVTGRHLYVFEKPGFITCVFQHHPRPHPDAAAVRSDPAPAERATGARRNVSREMLALSYVLEGEGRVRYAKQRVSFDVSAGWVFQYNLETGDDVHVELAPGSFECSICMDGETGRHLAALSLWKMDRLAEPIGLHASVIEKYVGIYRDLPEPGLSSGNILRRFVALVENVDTFADAADPNRRFRVEAQALLHAHPEPSYRMQEAAKAMGLSYEAFRQRFLKTVGIAPSEYQMRCRMERACERLEHGSVSETAASLGYTDPFVFSRQFHKRIGIPPSVYRRSPR